MTETRPSDPPRPRRIRPLLVVSLLIVLAVSTAAVGCHTQSSSSWSTPPPLTSSSPPPSARQLAAGSDAPVGGSRGALGEADGVVSDHVTVFDPLPAVDQLAPELLTALRQAATEAARHGVKLYVNSGWRSARYQDQLLREAVATYGSEEAAARWVATAATSPHVSGHAADLGPSSTTAWLSEHGAEYGLCQIYRNEPWHYELRAEAVHRGCPGMYANPTFDPRMRK